MSKSWEMEMLIKEVKSDIESLRYSIEDNKLHIYLVNRNNQILKTVNTFFLSKDKSSIVLNNGLLSLKNTFKIDNDRMSYPSNIGKIILASGLISISICEYKVNYSENFLKFNYEEILKVLSEVNIKLAEIFNDAFGHYDYEDVRLKVS